MFAVKKLDYFEKKIVFLGIFTVRANERTFASSMAKRLPSPSRQRFHRPMADLPVPPSPTQVIICPNDLHALLPFFQNIQHKTA